MRGIIKKTYLGLLFFIGWLLSPFTWWNDAFINMPLSYLLANLIFYVTRLPFRYLVIGSYLSTNILGLIFMYSGGKRFIFSFKDKLKTTVILFIILITYTAIMTYLDHQGKPISLEEFFRNIYHY